MTSENHTRVELLAEAALKNQARNSLLGPPKDVRQRRTVTPDPFKPEQPQARPPFWDKAIERLSQAPKAMLDSPFPMLPGGIPMQDVRRRVPEVLRQYQEKVAEPWYALVTADIFRHRKARARELREEGLSPIQAALQAQREVPLPSTQVRLPYRIPLPGGRSLQDIDVGLQGAVELAADPLNIAAFGAGPALKAARTGSRALLPVSLGQRALPPASLGQRALPPASLGQRPLPLPRLALPPGRGAAVAEDVAPTTPLRPRIGVAAKLPKELAGAKPNYNIGRRQYTPQFESDVDKALFIVSQAKKSLRDESYMVWLRSQLPDLSDLQIRVAGRGVRAHIKETVSGEVEGAVTIPLSATARGIGVRPAAPGTPAASGVGAADRPPPRKQTRIPSEDPTERPRSWRDMIREAKGQRALTPEQRAAIAAIKRPLSDVAFKVQAFGEPAKILLGAGTNTMKRLGSLPGMRQVMAIWNPAQLAWTNPVQMIGVRKAIFIEIETGRARVAALRWWNDAKTAFRFRKEEGLAHNVKIAPGVSKTKINLRTIDDMLENPENYIFTPEQTRVLQVGQDMMTQILRDAQSAGVDVVELGSAYWYKMVKDSPKAFLTGKPPVLEIGEYLEKFKSKMGSVKGHTYARVFKTTDEGSVALAKVGREYEKDPLRRLTARLEAGIETIANQGARKEISKLGKKGIQTPLERLMAKYPATVEGVKNAKAARNAAKDTYIKSKTPENLMAMRKSEADLVVAIRDLYQAKRIVATPNLIPIRELALPRGRIAPAELVDEIHKYIDLPELRRVGRGIDPIKVVSEMSQLSRTVLTNADLAAGYIQGQSLFFRNNVAWWKAQGQSVLALIDDPTAYVAKNFDLIDEGQKVAAISPPTEFLFARQGLASIPTTIPLIGPVMRSFNRAFEWFIFVGQTEMYKAARAPIWKAAAKGGYDPMDELVSLGSAIRKAVGTESYAILGVRPTQQTVEALSFFAARFARSIIGILGQSFTKGPGGAEARKVIGSALGGGISLTIGVSYLRTGKLPNLTDPFAPDWLQVPFGKTYFNAFGPLYPYLRTMARVSQRIAEGKPKEAGTQLYRFLNSKAGIPFRALDMAGQFAFTGEAETFEGEILQRTPLDIGKGITEEFFTPISIQEGIDALSEGRPEVVIELLGIYGRASPYNQMNIKFRQQKDINPKGLNWNEASRKKKDEMKKRFPELARLLLESGRGVYGKAAIEREEITNDRLAAEQKLVEEYLQDFDSDTFRKLYIAIQSDAASRQKQLNRDYNLFQENDELPEDPKKKAVVQYFNVFDNARSASGRFDFDKAEKELDELEAGWTTEVKEWVEESTGQADHPPFIQMYKAAKEILKPYWDLEKAFLSQIPTSSGRDIWQKYIDANDIVKLQMVNQMPGLKRADSAVREAKKRMRQQNPEVDIAYILFYGKSRDPRTGAQTREGQNLLIRMNQTVLGAEGIAVNR